MATEQPKITLHWLNGSRAQAILWLMEELHVPYELEVYHRVNMLAPPSLEKRHPLGKSPLITVAPPGSSEPTVIVESGFIVQYLCDHFGQGKTIVPKRWKNGQEGKILGETEEWMRYQHLLYYSEGSLMPWLVTYMLFSGLKGSQVPFLIRPITSAVANKVTAMLIFPNIKRHLNFLERQLETSPSGGSFLCGPDLTAADILLSYPLLAAKDAIPNMGKWEKGTAQETYPKVFAYMERLESQPGWKKSADKIREIDGKFSLVPETN